MATLTVKNLPDALYARLKEQAGSLRRSINAEAIVCLEQALSPVPAPDARSSSGPQRDGSPGLREAHADYTVEPSPLEEIDPQLLEEARRWSGADRAETLSAALDAYIARMKRLHLVELFGTVDFDPDYDYKAARRAR